MMTIRSGLPAVFMAMLLASALGAAPARAQVSATELLVRIDQLENQVRQLTGMVEQLQFRNQQLETGLRKMQEENEYRFQELGGKGGGKTAATPRPSPPPAYEPAPVAQQPAPQPPYVAPPSQPGYNPPSQPVYNPPPGPSGRRSDAFDPAQNPNAPGAPRPLGSLYASGSPPDGGTAPPGRAGAPLDLAGRSVTAANDPAQGGQGGLPAPPPRNTSATGARMATLAPSQTPRDEYDLAYGYLIRKDYDQADQSFRGFLRKYPNDPLAVDAQFGLGESLFQRRNYREAAEAFLAMTRHHGKSPRAPEALMRLGQSLAALGDKDLACSAFAEVGRKHPRVSPTVKQTVEREQKRVGC